MALLAGNAGAAARSRRAASHECASLVAAPVAGTQGIEALVVRDFYHRFTVDEHLSWPSSTAPAERVQVRVDKRFAELLGELEQPELLYLALLLHDSGKALPGDNHVEGSLN